MSVYLLKEMNRHGSVSFGFHIGRVFQREKEDLKNRAPTDAWREWLDWRSEGARIARIDHKERGIPFDYHRYLYDFKVNYIIDYLQDKKITK